MNPNPSVDPVFLTLTLSRGKTLCADPGEGRSHKGTVDLGEFLGAKGAVFES